MKMNLVLILGASISLIGCGSKVESLYLPDGDAEAGKVAFTELQCYGCHEVKGAEYPPPTTITPTYVLLGATGKAHSRTFLVESVIAPSHQFATPEPPPGQTAGEENVMSGTRSRMTDYGDRLTVHQLLDLTAYLEYMESLPVSSN
jgi:hypothetical protein